MGEGAWPALSPGDATGIAMARISGGPRESPSPKLWDSWQTAFSRLGQCWQSAQHEASDQPLHVLPRTSLTSLPGLSPCPEGTVPPSRLRAAPVTSKLEGQHPAGPDSRTELSCLRTAKGCVGPCPLPSR